MQSNSRDHCVGVQREINHIATGTSLSLEGELLPPHHGSNSVDGDGGEDGGGVDGEAFRGTSPSRRRAGTETPVPDLGRDGGAGRQINSSSVAAATRPPLFDGMHYKRWRTKAVLWFTNLGCFSATDARPEGPLSAEEQEKFEKVDAMFKAALFSILGDNIVDPYMAFDHGKDAWDALEAKFGVSDAGTELYVMEQYYDYRMTDERSVVEQAHEIQSLAKELEQFKSAGGTFMSITLGAATKLLDDMMINYSEWHTERTPQGKKVNSVEETSSLGDKIDAIMSMLANGRSHIDPNNVPLASLVAQEENVDVNFIKSNNFNNNAYRNNYGNNNYRPYPSNNGNGYGNSYGNSYNNNKSVPSGLEAMLKEFINTQTAFNKTVEEKLDKIDILASKVDSLALDVDLLKLKVMPEKVEDARFSKTNAIQVRINDNIRLLAELHARWDREEKEKLAKENNVAKVWTITTTSNVDSSHVAAPPTINGKIIGVGNVSTPSAKRTKLPETAETAVCDKTAEIFQNIGDNDSIAVEHNGLDFDDCHITEKKNFQSHKSKNKNNGKGKFDEKNKASNSTNFKRKTPYKKKGNCHVCGAPGHWAPDCPERHDRRGNSGKSANVVIGVDTEMKDVGYGRKDFLRADGKRLTCFCSWCWYGGSEVYFGKDHPAEECAARSLH
ncbi:hypothetical protein QYE76_044925 [Lolium multiflorum]|uniref:CCHC-type domain-containing protein n=1 Tax=Lolium multiflorum TaxID=4521 RepID=A0AAD8WX00_LOLMU|nr:hypothetical protein QYE76_044925 [Lolium multiflorum]